MNNKESRKLVARRNVEKPRKKRRNQETKRRGKAQKKKSNKPADQKAKQKRENKKKTARTQNRPENDGEKGATHRANAPDPRAHVTSWRVWMSVPRIPKAGRVSVGVAN
jgi:hypothetical protein